MSEITRKQPKTMWKSYSATHKTTHHFIKISRKGERTVDDATITEYIEIFLENEAAIAKLQGMSEIIVKMSRDLFEELKKSSIWAHIDEAVYEDAGDYDTFIIHEFIACVIDRFLAEFTLAPYTGIELNRHGGYWETYGELETN